MSSNCKTSQPRVPYLRKSVIEEHTQLVLDEWSGTHDAVTEPPVPIDDIVELHLGLRYELEDLQALFGHPDVLGAIWFGQKIVRVDQSLDPFNHPKMLGRYNFTLAHEAGHWRLHREYFVEDPLQKCMFDGRGQPAFVCRSSQNPPEEWQANFFAACLLMPRGLVRHAWEMWRGNLDAVSLADLPASDTLLARSEEEQNWAMANFCKPLADQFQVSAEAMRIRLQDLGYLTRQKEELLF